jgi:hypothetical protein
MNSSNLRSSVKQVYGNTSDSAACYSGLPERYHETKIILLPIDPIWMFAYWEITDDKIKDTSNKCGAIFEGAFLSLRIYDVTLADPISNNLTKFFDMKVEQAIGNAYINVGEFNRSWVVDIGYVLINGVFISLARSTVIALPHYGISPIIDEKWAWLEVDYDKIMVLPGLQGFGASSLDMIKTMNKRKLWKEFGSMPSSLQKNKLVK